MTNQVRGIVNFEALGQNWTLQLNTNAMCEIEDLTGHGISKVGQILANKETASIKMLRAVLCGMLKSHQPDITVAKCGDLIDAIGVNELGALIGQAFAAAFPKPEAKAKANPSQAIPASPSHQTGE